MMLQWERPEHLRHRFGEQYSMCPFVEAAAVNLDLQLEWRGKNTDEKKINGQASRCLIETDSRCLRRSAVDTPLGDSTRGQVENCASAAFEELACPPMPIRS
jgi:GDPmannose 4,6-dehydratase